MKSGRKYICAWVLLTFFALSGCASLSRYSTVDNLTEAILNQDDPEIVRIGAPAYLLLLDGLIEGEPKNRRLLQAAAEFYGAYATAFIDDELRAERLTEKAREYARRALCLRHPDVCKKERGAFEDFVKLLPAMGVKDVPALHVYAATWASWIGYNRDRWDALAELPKVEALLDRVVVLDEGYQQGSPHLYLGILRTQLTPALGGRPEVGKAHFERAIELSRGRNLMAKVEMAERYARMVFDKTLHDTLLKEVLYARVDYPGLVLSNVLAQQRARHLLETSEQYFEE